MAPLSIFGAIAMLVVLASPAHAVPDAVKCDKMKVKAAGKVFAKVLSCYAKDYADPSFDQNLCANLAHEKCVEKFNKADEKFAGACARPNNGPPICDEIRDNAILIYPDI